MSRFDTFLIKYGILLIILGVLWYAAWSFQKWINYKFGYGPLIKEQIIQIVRPECLK